MNNISDKIFIGVDLGTSAIKILASDIFGNVLSIVSKEYSIYREQGMYSEQNPEEWYKEFIQGLTEILSNVDKDKVVAIAFTGQMHGLVTLDDKDNIIRPAILWNDQRSYKECTFINNSEKYNILYESGNLAVPGFTLPKLLWMKKNEREKFNSIDKIMLPKDYLVYRITGEFVTDYSDASGTLLLDIKNRIWSYKILNEIGLDINKLPKLKNSYDVIGKIKQELANELEIKNVNVIIGGGDQPIAAIGSGVTDDGVSVSLGTSGVVYSNIKKYPKNMNGKLNLFSSITKEFCFMGVTLSAAESLKWWGKISNYDLRRIDEEISPLMKNNIIFLPYLSGERTPHNDSFAKGVFFGFDIGTNNIDLTKSVLEGVSFSLKECLDLIKKYKKVDYVVINGGGSKSEVWCKILADVLQLPIKIMDNKENTALGAAITSMVGLGFYEDVRAAIASIIKVKKVYMPNDEMNSYYCKKYKKYKNLYINNKNLFKN